jgi:hypothetical protein
LPPTSPIVIFFFFGDIQRPAPMEQALVSFRPLLLLLFLPCLSLSEADKQHKPLPSEELPLPLPPTVS